MVHRVDYRVYYEDTDAVGIMYHANFINFCERGRSELLREVGLPASQIEELLGIGFVVRHLDAEYLDMVKLDDLLTVETMVKAMKNSSFLMTQNIVCNEKIVFTMNVTIVCLDKSGKPVKIPDELRQKFDQYTLERLGN
jgi:acyl-CoA thioester hydrolase